MNNGEFDFGDLLADLLRSDDSWSKPLSDSLRARVLMVTLFSAAMKLVHDLRSRGSMVEMGEWTSEDSFELKAKGREVRFHRPNRGTTVVVICSGVPSELKPAESSITPPNDIDSIKTHALEIAKWAVRALFA